MFVAVLSSHVLVSALTDGDSGAAGSVGWLVVLVLSGLGATAVWFVMWLTPRVPGSTTQTDTGAAAGGAVTCLSDLEAKLAEQPPVSAPTHPNTSTEHQPWPVHPIEKIRKASVPTASPAGVGVVPGHTAASNVADTPWVCQ